MRQEGGTCESRVLAETAGPLRLERYSNEREEYRGPAPVAGHMKGDGPLTRAVVTLRLRNLLNDDDFVAKRREFDERRRGLEERLQGPSAAPASSAPNFKRPSTSPRATGRRS